MANVEVSRANEGATCAPHKACLRQGVGCDKRFGSVDIVYICNYNLLGGMIDPKVEYETVGQEVGNLPPGSVRRAEIRNEERISGQFVGTIQ